MKDIRITRFTFEDRDWLVQSHGTHYARDEGFDDSFGPLVAGIVDDFIADHDPAREAGWIARDGDTRLGSIFCVALDAETAKLRLFLLSPEARGQGLGHRMLTHNMAFARDAGYRRMQLWTHESHRVAGALYAAHGWHLDRSFPVHSFGQDLVEQAWSITL